MAMEAIYIDALTYLSSFEEGLSHYNWDRVITYKLKYNVHPGELIRFFIDEGLIINKTPVSSTNYVLNSTGRMEVKKNLEELQPLTDRINKALMNCIIQGIHITVESRPPFFSLKYKDATITVWINRSKQNLEIECSFPSETELRVNKILLTRHMLEKTNLLDDLVLAHIRYIYIINNKSSI